MQGKLQIWTVLLALLVLCVCENNQGIVFVYPQQVHKPWCTQDADFLQFKAAQESLFDARAASMGWVTIQMTHFVKGIIQFINGKKEYLTNIINNSISNGIQFIAIFVMQLLLLSAMTVYWCMGIFSNKAQSDERRGIQLPARTQIGMAGMVVGLLLVTSFCIYGIGSSHKITRTVDFITCRLAMQNVDFLHQQSNATLEKGTVAFAQQIVKFQAYAQKRVKQLTPLYNSSQLKQLAVKTRQLLKAMQSSSKYSSFLNDLNSTAINMDLAVSILGGLNQQIVYYNDTIQYLRQVLLAMKFLFGNVDKFGSRYIGFDNISAFLTNLTTKSLIVFVIVGLIAVVGVFWVTVSDKQEFYYIKHIGQYLIGVCCLMAILVAIINSVLIPFLFANNQYVHYFRASPGNVKGEFANAQGINGYLVQIISHFFSNAQGSVWHYYDSSLLNNLLILQQILPSLTVQHTKLLQLQAQAQSSQVAQSISLLMTAQLQKLIKTALQSVNGIIYQMRDPNGLIGKLDTRALGKQQLEPVVAQGMLRYVFNRMYDMRVVFGGCGVALMLMLASTALVRQIHKSYVKLQGVKNAVEQMVQPQHHQQDIVQSQHNQEHMVQSQNNYQDQHQQLSESSG